MNQKHRNTIDSRCKDIVPRINLVALWPKLLENKIFNRDDVNVPRWKANLTDKATVRDVYLTIKTRGPHAFDRFVKSLRQSGHESLADILEGKEITFSDNETETTVGQNNVVNNDTTKERNCSPTMEEGQDNFFHYMQQSEVPLQIQVRKAIKFLDGPVYENVNRYPMRSNPRGLVLIVTNIQYKYSDGEPRSSAARDEENIKDLFNQMGFQVISYNDLTGEQLVEKVKQFSQHKDLRKVDSCFVIIGSHGNISTQYEVTEIEGVEYNSTSETQTSRNVLCRDLLDYFTAEVCPDLAGKPKVFIFQLCRGKKAQKSVINPRHTTDITSNFQTTNKMIDPKVNYNKTMRNYEDILVAQATLPGHVAFRDKITGSWFIQILCEVFMNYAYKTHIQDLLNMVDERLKTQRSMKDECQTLTVTSIGFNKHCYLNPGIFKET
ncbi:PREDICTED: caspase-3 [Dufourea novaeangliae]|uniref:Caspase Nc n=1 Tax=Dufourea novaeangliae TaxID=178035 RepID=A0A154PF69_DUFNO|nr:PREDICTED: caspase-3 [Dufourea novaeangliae]KZC10457.1 Caspase Nc [Dufourea novaeangliae]